MKQALHEKITATELVRNLSTVIDKVRISGQSMYITKGSQTIAKLSPPPKAGYPINKLASLLGSLPKLGDDAETLSKDMRVISKGASLPENPWD